MKILHLQVIPKLSGVQNISKEIFKGLPEDWEKWILFSDSTNCGDKEECEKAFKNLDSKIIYSPNLIREINLKKDIKAFKEIYNLCKREKFDIVHTNSTKPGIIGRMAAFLAGTPMVIHTVHGLSFHKFMKFPKWQFYWMCEMFSSFFCHRIVLVNKYYSKYFKFFKKKTKTIYNGIEINKSINKLPSQDFPKLLFIGRLDEQKDPITLLKSLLIVKNKYPKIRLTIVGDGELKDTIKEFITEHQLESNVVLAGWSNDVKSFYETHDIFVSTSIYEAFGLTLVEAGLYELPVVSTTVEGIPEVVKDGETGLLSKPKDPESIANNIIKLIEDKNLRRSLGKASRERVINNFSIDRMNKEYLDIYNQLKDK